MPDTVSASNSHAVLIAEISRLRSDLAALEATNACIQRDTATNLAAMEAERNEAWAEVRALRAQLAEQSREWEKCKRLNCYLIANSDVGQIELDKAIADIEADTPAPAAEQPSAPAGEKGE